MAVQDEVIKPAGSGSKLCRNLGILAVLLTGAVVVGIVLASGGSEDGDTNSNNGLVLEGDVAFTFGSDTAVEDVPALEAKLGLLVDCGPVAIVDTKLTSEGLFAYEFEIDCSLSEIDSAVDALENHLSHGVFADEEIRYFGRGNRYEMEVFSLFICGENTFGQYCYDCPVCAADRAHCDEGVGGTGLCLCESGFASSSGMLCDVCDTGFYGDACFECPTCPFGSHCEDGLSGTGTCICDLEGFTGPSCSRCEDGRYGPTCDECTVDCNGNGYCDEGITGSGQCTCLSGFTGEFCDDLDLNTFDLLNRFMGINVAGDSGDDSNSQSWVQDFGILNNGPTNHITSNSGSFEFFLQTQRRWIDTDSFSGFLYDLEDIPNGKYTLKFYSVVEQPEDYIVLQGTQVPLGTYSTSESCYTVTGVEVTDNSLTISFDYDDAVLGAFELYAEATVISGPNNFDLGDVEVLQQLSQTVILKNLHDSEVTIDSFTTNHEDFTIDATFPIVLGADESISVLVTFSPLSIYTASVNAELNLVSSDVGIPTIFVSGKGVASFRPVLSFPTSVAFGESDIPLALKRIDEPFKKFVNVSNLGLQTLHLTSLTFEYYQSVSKEYFQTTVSPNGMNVDPLGTRSVEIHFLPPWVGEFTGKMTILSNAVVSTHEVALTGHSDTETRFDYRLNVGEDDTNVYFSDDGKIPWTSDSTKQQGSSGQAVANPSCQPNTVECSHRDFKESNTNFGEVVYRLNVETQGYFFVSLWVADGNLGSVGFEGKSSSEYDTIDKGSADGKFIVLVEDGTLDISIDDAVKLQAIEVTQKMVLLSDSAILDFHALKYGSVVEESFNVINVIQNFPVDVSTIGLLKNGPGFAVVDNAYEFPRILADQGSSMEVIISASPFDTSGDAGSVEVLGDNIDPASRYVQLQVEGGYDGPILSASKTVITFDPIPSGGNSAFASFRLSNRGDVYGYVESFTFDDPAFELSDTSILPLVIHPEEGVNVALRFTGPVSKVYTALMTISAYGLDGYQVYVSGSRE